MDRKKMFFFSLIVLLASIPFASIGETKEFRFKWGASSVRSFGYGQTVAYAKVIHQAYPGEILITVVETGGNIEIFSRLKLRLLHLGGTNPLSAYIAYNGLYDFKDHKNPNIRMLMATAVTPFSFVVGKDTGVSTLEGLNGLKMATNPITTSERLGRLLLEANGINPVYKWGGTSSNLEAMKAKTVDAWSRPGFRDGAITELALTRPINLLPITEEHLKKYNEKWPAHGKGILSPAGQYKNQDKPYYTLAFVEGVLVDKDVPEEIVYKIVKAIWNKRTEMIKVDAILREGGFADFPKLTIEYCDSPLHSGVIRFFRELELKIPGKLLSP